MTTAFHFLRPEWLWALLPAAFLGQALLRRNGARATEGWARHVDAHLLRHLALDGAAGKRGPLVPVIAALAVIATIFGLAGPTWEERDMPSFEGGAPVVTVLSLAQTMNSDDLTPTRLKRAGHKLRDILARTEGDERGLVIYADTPFVAAPLTSDPKVIEEMLPELSTSLMPVLGNRLDKAITAAQGMLQRGGATRGTIVVMADDAGNDPAASLAAARAAAKAGYTVSVLGVGTEDGATLQTADRRAIKTRDGKTLHTALAKDDLQALAKAGGGKFAMVTANDADLTKLLPASDGPTAAGAEQDFQTDGWVDMGYWLLILPVLVLPFAFRRGLILALGLLALGLAQPQTASAGIWEDLWATRDQQGKQAFENQSFDSAAQLFETPEWQGSAAYRAGDFARAAGSFAGNDYNRGNAQAKAGKLEEALASYDQALKANPDDADARFNRDLVAKLLEQQKQQQQQQNQKQDQQKQGQQDQKDQQKSGNSGDKSDNKDQQQQSGNDSQQQQKSGGQDSKQADNQDQKGQSGAQNQQADAQEQSGDKPQDKTGAQQQAQADQKQSSDGDKSQKAEDQKTDAQKQAGAEDQQQPQQGAQQAAQNQPQPAEGAQDGKAPEQANADDQSPSLADRLSDMIKGRDDSETGEKVEASIPGAEPLNQAVEQQLRRVQDDPSGLLRARIRQHYARMQTNG